ncbi:MAG: branched-chain amino acid ABC transporter substrate-binding protein [Candidatus Eremiobacteraeota bacterium]|nr:branched-chain amino acid ABC transporter substrate-binding protein [Candidatus Eremiobacteraeota bacterium]MBV9055618.1 branched-chain amino acid ABC transporter substrate-binding protein [Candidatus Eremiobacteraeota bacterium]
MRRRHFVGCAAAAVLAGRALPIKAQTLPPPIGAPQFLPQLTIAVNVTLSGDLQKYGNEIVKGVTAAVDETNRFNAPVSHVWGVRPLDDRDDPALAAANANVAAGDSTVVAIVGNLSAAMTLAALRRYANTGFAVVVPTVTADAVTQRGFHNVYRLPAKDSTAGRLFAGAALEGKRGVPAIAVAFDGDYGYEVAQGFVTEAKRDGHPADVLLFPLKSTTPPAAARTVLDRSPQYVFLAGKTAELGPVAEALRAAGYRGDFGASDGFYNTQTIETYASVLDGAYVASPLPPLTRVPSAVQLVTDFEREVSQVTAFSAYAYGAAQLLISASQRANATTRTTVLRSLQSGGVFTTIVGQFGFNISGDPLIPNIYLYTVHKDGFKYDRPAIRTGFVL